MTGCIGCVAYLFLLFVFLSSVVNMDLRISSSISGLVMDAAIPSGSGGTGIWANIRFFDLLVCSWCTASYFLGNLHRDSMAGKLCSVTQVGFRAVSRRVLGPPAVN